MLNHIGMVINKVSEIENFYQNILGMKIVKQFRLDRELSNKIFKIDRETDVYMMQKDDLILELFVAQNPDSVNYQHICISVHSRKKIIEKAKKDNYSCLIMPRKKYDIVFIKDSSGNIFEVKEE